MKKILQLALVCGGLGLVAMSTSCSKDYNAMAYPGQDTTKNSFRGTFTASIDGEYFSAENKWAHDTTIDNVRSITISGVMDSKQKDPATNKTIALSINNYQGPGTYVIQSGTAGIYINQDQGTSTPYLAKAGDTLALINITNDQVNLEGNFSFVVAPNGLGESDNHNITDGSFSVPK